MSYHDVTNVAGGDTHTAPVLVGNVGNGVIADVESAAYLASVVWVVRQVSLVGVVAEMSCHDAVAACILYAAVLYRATLYVLMIVYCR